MRIDGVAVPKPQAKKKRAPKPMKRSRMKCRGPRTKKSGGHLFTKGRNPEYLAYVRSFPCAICIFAGIEQESRTRACHVKSRGSSGGDVANTYPGCDRHHEEQHLKGFAHMKRKYRVDLPEVALRLGEQYGRWAA